MVGKLGDFEDEETKLPSRHGVLKLTSFIIIELLPIARANYYYIRLIVVNYYNVNVTDFLKRAVFSLSGRRLKEFRVLTVKSCARDIYSYHTYFRLSLLGNI